MEMKDKLTKNGRKLNIWIKTRRFVFTTLIIAILGVGISVATYFSVYAPVKAEEEQNTQIVEVTESEELTSY